MALIFKAYAGFFYLGDQKTYKNDMRISLRFKCKRQSEKASDKFVSYSKKYLKIQQRFDVVSRDNRCEITSVIFTFERLLIIS